MEIDRTYRFNETINHKNNVGTYDMVINYQNKQNNINESIILEDFLTIYR